MLTSQPACQTRPVWWELQCREKTFHLLTKSSLLILNTFSIIMPNMNRAHKRNEQPTSQSLHGNPAVIETLRNSYLLCKDSSESRKKKYLQFLDVNILQSILEEIVVTINLDPIYQREKREEERRGESIRKFRRQINIKREKD